MVSYREREKLMRDFHNAPARGLGLVAKCVACLLLLVGIALVNTWSDPSETSTVAAVADSAGTLPEQAPRIEDGTTAPQPPITR